MFPTDFISRNELTNSELTDKAKETWWSHLVPNKHQIKWNSSEQEQHTVKRFQRFLEER